MTKGEFERLYQENFTIVYRYLLKLCQQPDLAEEITSETFFKAINSIHSFRGNCSLNSWLCQIAKNSYYEYLRKNKRLVELDRAVEQADDKNNPEEQLIEAMYTKEICRRAEQLEEPYKSVFKLRIFQEFSFRQIAGIFGKTENWACVTFHRARKKLKESMEV